MRKITVRSSIENSRLDRTIVFVVRRLDRSTVYQRVPFDRRGEHGAQPERAILVLRSGWYVPDLRLPPELVVAKFIDMVVVATGDPN